MNYLFDWLHARQCQDLSSPLASFIDNSVWQHPPTIMLKCNIDGAIFQNSNSIGVGMIFRDDTGSFFATR